MSSSGIDPRWESFASREPHFAVLSAPRFLQRNLTPETEREFFASGEALVAWMLGVIDAALVPAFAPMTILEYGCGIGRLALPLARHPASIVAVDRSPAMLARARQEAELSQLGHIRFQTPETLFAADSSFDLVVCYHVLQRLPHAAALALIRRLASRLAPGGVGVFQWPCRSSASALVRASRRMRESVPGVNAAVNALRGKGSGDPFIPTRLFDLSRTLREFDARAFRATHVALQPMEGLEYAIAFVEKRSRPPSAPRPTAASLAAARPASVADVTEADLAALNAAAEAYFSSLPDWDHHLAKPFSQTEETPVLLMNLAVALQALRITPGLRVLEFGAGSGWLSRFLTQMGCRVVVLDVSETALRMAREVYARQPVIGVQPPPEFLRFDGRRIDAADGSIDRILCFDAFHHAPNPRAIVGEFGRVLAAGGIAAFAEPGPRHAGAPRSQFEVQTYGVVERDVDVHDIWRTAQAHGFHDLRMSVFHGPPYQVPLEDYEQLVAGGAAQGAWLESTRRFLRHVRFFALVKAGSPRPDSGTAERLRCQIRVALATPQVWAHEPIAVDAVVTNTGLATWLPADAGRGGVTLGTHLYDAAGGLAVFDFNTAPLTRPPREIAPGETVRCAVTLPPLVAGQYRIEFDCVASRVAWFAQAGSAVSSLEILVERRPGA
jgi:2-polyprenyl-3-methyl-5-hydroxy-6-metoxy-1,4-benzoquinol methylase